jgi:hypothetical protein
VRFKRRNDAAGDLAWAVSIGGISAPSIRKLIEAGGEEAGLGGEEKKLMADQFGASPDQVRKVAGGLHGVGSDFAELVSELRAEVGDGGDALTNGDASSFWQQLNSLTAAMADQAKWLTGLGDNLGVVANSAQSSDQQA